MEQLLTKLKALADERRLKIIEILLHFDLCVGALARHLAISEAAASQQLQILRKAGLVRGKNAVTGPIMR
jgi:DNA-binding transcriptional ArsR family regulator